jgi:hypothetical protein
MPEQTKWWPMWTPSKSVRANVEATHLESNLEATEAVVERQEFRKKEINFDKTGHWMTDTEIDIWLCVIAESKEAHSRQCWVQAEVVCRPEATDT